MNETWHTQLFGIYKCVEVVRIDNSCHMLEIKGQVAVFNCFFNDYVTF